MTQWRRLVMTGLVLALAAWARAGAAATPPETSARTIVQVHTVPGGLHNIFDDRQWWEFERRENRRFKVQANYEADADTGWAARLSAGQVDLAEVWGPKDLRRHPYYHLLSPGLRDRVEDHVLACRAMAVAVHPESPLREIDADTVRRIILSFRTTSDRTDDPFADRKLEYARDEVAATNAMAPAIFGPGGRWDKNPSEMPSAWERHRLLEAAAARPNLMIFTVADEKLWKSGLRVLPVRVAPDRAPVAPTVGNILSGAYPYQFFLHVVVHPDASQAARAVLRELRGPAVAELLAARWWIVEQVSRDPEGTDEAAWPEPDPKARPAAVSGAAAVLPVQALSPHFLLGGPSLSAVLEQKVGEGVAAGGPLALVDRAALARVLEERRLAAAGVSSPAPAGPVLAADVLVAACVVTIGRATVLHIQAFHSATASCLGELKVPVDASDPEGFAAGLPRKVAAWWPGVLRNLAAANSRPVWTVLETGAADAATRQRAGRMARGLRDRLAADGRVFLADPTLMPDARCEVLMQAMGLARPRGQRFTPAADYILELRAASAERMEMRLLRGSDMAALASGEVGGGDDDAAARLAAWVGEHLAKPPRPAPASPGQSPATADFDFSSARAQAELEHARGLEIKRLWEALLPDKDNLQTQREMVRLRGLATNHFARASQLDPAWEDPAWELLLCMPGAIHGSQYAAFLDRRRRLEEFLEKWPRSARREMIVDSLRNKSGPGGIPAMRAFAGDDAYQTDEGPPRGRDDQAEWKAVDRSRLRWTAEYFARVLPQDQPEKWPLGGTLLVELSEYQDVLRRFLQRPDVAPEEAAEVLAGWRRTFNHEPSPFATKEEGRLTELSRYNKRAEYIAYLTELQKERPDPKDPFWSKAKYRILVDLAGMFKKVPPEKNSFLQWLKGARGIGGLPYEGYVPGEEVKAK